MGVKGALEYQKFKKGIPLTRKGALFAQCYECNGFEGDDCLATHCPLYQWSPYNKSLKNRVLNKEKPYPKALIEANQRRREQKTGDEF